MSMASSMPSPTTAMSTMASMSMSMASSMASATASASSAHSHGSMSSMSGMGSSDGPACKISMLWNWNVENACFLADSWHITSRGMFAGTCIGIIALVVALEFVRRIHREYDRYIVRQWKIVQHGLDATAVTGTGATTVADHHSTSSNTSFVEKLSAKVRTLNGPLISNRRMGILGASDEVFSPTLFQQLVRSLFYAVTAGAGYIVMLLLMYFNGYIFFCVLIGTMIGYFFFESDVVATANQKLVTCC